MARRGYALAATLCAAQAVRMDRGPGAAADALLEAASGASFPVRHAIMPLLAESQRHVAITSQALGRDVRGAAEQRALPGLSAGYARADAAEAVRTEERALADLVKPSAPARAATQSEVHISLGEVRAKAWAMPGDEPGGSKIALPPQWESQLLSGSIVIDDGAPPQLPFHGRATLAVSGAKVAFSASSHGHRCHVSALSRLSHTGCVPALVDSTERGGVSYLLMESVGGRTLEAHLSGQTAAGAGSPHMDDAEALRILLDLLPGLVQMEADDLVHGDLQESTILITAPGRRAVMTDFSSACFVRDGCSIYDDVRFSPASAYHAAPEMLDGMPTGVPNNVWQVGVVFARMLLGGVDPWAAVFADAGGAADRSAAEIRAAIRKQFSFRDMPGFEQLGSDASDLKAMLAGMLEKDPRRRWTAARCFDEAAMAASRRGMPVHELRTPSVPAAAWHLDPF